MKQKFCTAICALSLWHITSAQSEFFVGNNAPFDIKENTTVYLNGLILQPGNSYSIANTEMYISNSVTHYTVQNYVSGAVTFSNNIPPFSGVLGYHYSDDNLNGITESALAIKIHNGYYWQSIPTASRNEASNMILSNYVSNLNFREMVLADQFVALPLIWGPVQAIRNNNDISVNWSTRSEQAVSHFQVERSADGRQWLAVGNVVDARNIGGEQNYSAVDRGAPAHRLYYRIRQQDFDGRITYSAVVTAAAIGESLSINVFPNPASGSFRLTGVDVLNIQKVEVFDTRGALVLSFSKAQNEYDIRSVASGVYHVRIQTRNGDTQNQQLIKK